ncbi:hypothetical protein CHM34_04065 [Paludifilum halophilum]|uniref:DUF3168 domain-containing protein n=1 Tax=Paludifilum halophilum TaxID=1642702 RepID=A0A235BAF2_9BACL|nr:hypothetical protein CHM34_04065 [Paludifilum halophilum]
MQQAVTQHLSTDEELMSKVSGVFDGVPENEAFPFVAVGGITSSPFRTFSRFGEEVTLTLHIWSDAQGFSEANEILEDLNRLLADRNLDVDGYGTASCRYVAGEAEIDPETPHRKILVDYQLLVQAT